MLPSANLEKHAEAAGCAEEQPGRGLHAKHLPQQSKKAFKNQIEFSAPQRVRHHSQVLPRPHKAPAYKAYI